MSEDIKVNANAMLYTPQSSPGRPPLPVVIEPSSSPLRLPSSSLSPASLLNQKDGGEEKEGVAGRVFYERTNVQRCAAVAAQRRASEFFSRKADAGSASITSTSLLPTPPRSSSGSGLGHEEEDDGEPPAKKRRYDEADDLVDTDIEKERDVFHADDEEIRDTKLYHASFVSSSSTTSVSSSFSSSSSSRTAVSARQTRARDVGPTVSVVGTARRAMMMSGMPRFANGNVRRYS